MSDSKDQGRRKPGNKTSGSYGLVLGQRIRAEGGVAMDKARASYEQAVSESPAPPPIAEPKSEGTPEPARPKFGSEPGTTPSARDPHAGPTAKEVGDATVALTQSVDEICQALIMVFGKIEGLVETVETSTNAVETSTNVLRAVTRVLTLLLAVQVIVFGLMGYMVWRIESVVHSAAENRVEQAQTSAELRRLVVGFSQLQRSAEATRRTVDDVAAKADESPKVEIVADKDRPGSAVVRILPPTPAPVTTAPRSSAAPKGTGTNAPAVPTPPPVEIPIQIDKARPARDTDARP